MNFKERSSFPPRQWRLGGSGFAWKVPHVRYRGQSWRVGPQHLRWAAAECERLRQCGDEIVCQGGSRRCRAPIDWSVHRLSTRFRPSVVASNWKSFAHNIFVRKPWWSEWSKRRAVYELHGPSSIIFPCVRGSAPTSCRSPTRRLASPPTPAGTLFAGWAWPSLATTSADRRPIVRDVFASSFP